MFPQYLLFGMSSDEYWNGNPWLARGYYEYYRLRLQEENRVAWLNGRYVHDAVAVVMANSFGKGVRAKYPASPYDIFPKEKRETEDEAEQEREKVTAFFNRLIEEQRKRKQAEWQKQQLKP